MTTNDAYQLTLKMIETLKQKGIETKITPVQSTQELDDKYNGDGRISSDKWILVDFLIKTDEDLKNIFIVEDELSKVKIGFDTDSTIKGEPKERGWKLDFSFFYDDRMNKMELLKYFYKTIRSDNPEYPLLSHGFGGDKVVTLLTLGKIIMGNKEKYTQKEIKELFKYMDSGWSDVPEWFKKIKD